MIVPEPPDGSSKIVSLQNGGYYANEVEGSYEIFRILAVDADMIHIQPQAPVFADLPTTDEQLDRIHPSMSHLPLSLQAIFMFTYHYIATAELDDQDLAGYAAYLEGLGASPSERKQRIESLKLLSLQPAVRIDFTYQNHVITQEILPSKSST